MKFFSIAFSALSILFGMPVSAEEPLRSPSMIGSVSRVAAEGNPDKALVLLDEIQTIDEWRFGGGVGPWNGFYLNRLALLSFKPILRWDTPAVGDLISNPASQIQKWICADRTSDSAMMAMLSSGDPTARWIACEKLTSLGVVSPNLLPQLRSLAVADDYLSISRWPRAVKPGERPKPRPFDEEHGFRAVLREGAIELLKLAGEETIKIDRGQLTAEGLIWLGKQFVARANDPIARLGMVDALFQLDPSTPEIVEAKKKLRRGMNDDEQFAFFQALAKSALPERYVPINNLRSSGVTDLPSKEDKDSANENAERRLNQSGSTSQGASFAKWALLLGAVLILVVGSLVWILRSKRTKPMGS